MSEEMRKILIAEKYFSIPYNIILLVVYWVFWFFIETDTECYALWDSEAPVSGSLEDVWAMHKWFKASIIMYSLTIPPDLTREILSYLYLTGGSYTLQWIADITWFVIAMQWVNLIYAIVARFVLAPGRVCAGLFVSEADRDAWPYDYLYLRGWILVLPVIAIWPVVIVYGYTSWLKSNLEKEKKDTYTAN